MMLTNHGIKRPAITPRKKKKYCIQVLLAHTLYKKIWAQTYQMDNHLFNRLIFFNFRMKAIQGSNDIYSGLVKKVLPFLSLRAFN